VQKVYIVFINGEIEEVFLSKKKLERYFKIADPGDYGSEVIVREFKVNNEGV